MPKAFNDGEQKRNTPGPGAFMLRFGENFEGFWLMRRFGSCLCVAALWMLHAAGAHAGVVDAPGADLEVSLITYGPGAIYWERFGHDAIQIRDRVSGQSVDFNYGVFDFDERGFLLNFARGYMHYMIDAERSDVDESDYIDSGRSVVRQRLAFTPAQAVSLRAFLIWNLQPENAGYRYDYLVNNCATRVRDALNAALNGALRGPLTAAPGAMTYRQQIVRLMSAQPWLMLAMDLGLGPAADRPLNGWQESFLPMVLERQLRDVKVGAGAAATPLVLRERRIAPNRLPPPPARPPDLGLPLALAGLAFAAAVAATRRRLARISALIGTLYLAFAGIAGIVLAALWTLTMHWAAWRNANLLVFNPAAFAFIGPLWRARRGRGPSTWTTRLIAAQLTGVALAVLLHLWPGVVQQNQPWLLFATPCWLALAWTLRTAAPQLEEQPT